MNTSTPPGAHDPDPHEEVLVQKLHPDECWHLLERAELGRLAVEGVDGRPDVFPVNYLVHRSSIYVRSAPGTKLRDIAARPDVAFEVDGEDIASHWSVVVRGTARRLDVDAEIEESTILDLESWSPTRKHDFVRLTSSSVTGRRFHKRRPLDEEPHPEPDAGHKPVPIPHFPPQPED